MYIWLINHYAVPPQYYPLARQTYFAKNLMAMGHKVTIISASTVHNSDIDLIINKSKWKRESVDGIDHVYIKCCHYKGNGLKRIYNMCEFAWKLPGVCKKLEKPDAIVATSMPPMSCAAGIKIAKKYGIPGIAEIADLWPESIVAYGIAKASNPIIRCLRRLEKWIYINADAIVFTMENAYQYIINQGWQNEIPRSKVHYINNGVDLEKYEKDKIENPFVDADLQKTDQFNIVYTGSIRKVNNVGIYLDIASRIKNPNINILIWGSGDELESLINRQQQEGLTNVKFKGVVEKRYIPSITSQASANIIHGGNKLKTDITRYGISPNKLFEYAASGKPIITVFSNGQSPADIYHAGISIESDDIDVVVEIIEKFASIDRNGEDYKLYCQSAKQMAIDYDFKSLTKKLIDVINSKTLKG